MWTWPSGLRAIKWITANGAVSIVPVVPRFCYVLPIPRPGHADLVERDRDQLADMDARCTGRSPMEPRMVDVPNAIGTLRAAAGWANMIQGRTIPTAGYMGINTFSYTRLEPIGVVGAIVPWNAPLMILTWKLGALLAAGCTAVIKPAEETPMSALHVAKLCQEDFPMG